MSEMTWEKCAAAGMSKAEAARAMGRSYSTAESMEKRRGLKFAIKYGRLWTPDEDAYVAENLGSMTDEEIGKALGRSKGAIKDRRLRFKLASAQPQDVKPKRRTGVSKGVNCGANAPEAPPKPKGVSAAQRLYASAYPDCPEARMIRAFLGEDIRRSASEAATGGKKGKSPLGQRTETTSPVRPAPWISGDAA